MQIATKLYKTSHLAICQKWYFVQIHHLFYKLLSLELNLNSIKYFQVVLIEFTYRIVAISSPSRIEAHADLFRLLMKGIFDPYVL